MGSEMCIRDSFRNQINSFPYISLIGSSSASFDNIIFNGFNPLNISNAGLSWEKSVEVNPGIDFGFYNNRLSGSLDIYKRTSEDLLLDVPVSYTTGFPNALDNRGKVENKGIELELRTKNIMRPSFQWSNTFIVSRNKNKLLDFAESNNQPLLSKRSSGFLADCVNDAVTLTVCFAPISITFSNS